MDLVKKLEPLWMILVILVSFNAAVGVLFDTDIVNKVLGSGTPADVFYVAAGVGALTFVPKLMEQMHVGSKHGAHPHGV